MKRTRRFVSIVALASAVSLLGAACGDKDDDSSSGSGEKTSDIKVGLAYDVGGRGDKSFNDAAAIGLDEAKKDLGVEGKELSPSKDEDREANLILLGDLCEVMTDGSLCAMGGLTPLPVRSALAHFGADFQAPPAALL